MRTWNCLGVTAVPLAGFVNLGKFPSAPSLSFHIHEMGMLTSLRRCSEDEMSCTYMKVTGITLMVNEGRVFFPLVEGNDDWDVTGLSSVSLMILWCIRHPNN